MRLPIDIPRYKPQPLILCDPQLKWPETIRELHQIMREIQLRKYIQIHGLYSILIDCLHGYNHITSLYHDEA